MYRTGDQSYWDEQGELRLYGRVDRQIKLRGFRIDLDDIETRILDATPGCTGVVVAHDSDNDYLVAQLQPEILQTSDVKRLLRRVLPNSAVPRHVVAVSEFPWTNVGKIDYRSIKNSFTASLDIPVTNPVDSTLLDKIVRAWREILGKRDLDLSLESNFFELGGHLELYYNSN
ncbi:hypothetical protein DL768_006767 [Monosporascus sp. mg162]|nr:hypothetical protein DL768_006767 [Monosporascus sp. mg162]